MTTRSLLMVGTLALASLGIASAKSYDVILSSPAKAGSIELRPGEYKLRIDGSQATFSEARGSKSWTAPVKIDSVERKFDQTVVETTHQGDIDNISAIELGGSRTKVEFGQ